jgi:hypothetical protein
MADNTRPAEIVHAGWKAGMNATCAQLEWLAKLADLIHAGLVNIDAGESQTRWWKQGITQVNDVLTEAAAILEVYGRAGDEVGEAQAAAGGEKEVYGDKHANTTG